MKSLFFLSCALLLFPPQGETATAVRPVPDTYKPIIVPGQQRPGAFKSVPLRAVGRCGTLCATHASEHLSPEAVKALNRSQFQKPLETKTASALALMPALSAQLSLTLRSPQKVQKTTSAVVGAIVESPRWNDPVAQAEIFNLVESIVTEGVNGREKQLENIEKDCAI